jgi:hypothetical protein
MCKLNYESYRKMSEEQIRSHCANEAEATHEIVLSQLSEALNSPMIDAHIEDVMAPEGEDYKALEYCSYKKVSKLMSHFVVVKGDVEYEMADVEFYYFSKAHPDITTYPRQCDGGRWFFHQSGVDITLRSTLSYTDDHRLNPQGSTFGGLLLRALIKHNPDGTRSRIEGPLKCVDELWDSFSAIAPTEREYPQLQYKELGNCTIQRQPRHFPLTPQGEVKKYDALCRQFASCEVTPEEFDRFLSLRYRFVRDDLHTYPKL